MERKTVYWNEQKVSAQLSVFSNVDTEEMHVLFHIESNMDLFDSQFSRFSEAFAQIDILIKTGLKAKKLERLKNESEDRLRDRSYAETLRQLGYNVPDKYL